MIRLDRASRAIVTVIAIVGMLLAPGGAPAASAAEVAPDSSDVVLVLDFSASILNDARNRGRFAAALERMADRVDATSADLVAGDTTVTLVQFASSAQDVEGCADLRLLGNPEAVAQFADCLRSLGTAYREGLDPELTAAIGIDTNYVEAMEQAAAHLPADAERPTMILFTDGRHDVAGVPVGEVAEAHQRLFGNRSPFALLPVGMGLDADDRDALTAGLEDLRVLRDMPPCVSGTVFEWPQVVFQSPDDAGNAVAVALQGATCTFTVAPSEPPEASPTPTPVPAPGGVQGIELTPGDGLIDLSWSPPSEGAAGVTDYRARCSGDDGVWIESAEGVSTEPRARVDGLEQGQEYRCEVAVVTAAGDGDWTAAAATAVPLGIPAAPAKPGVTALNSAVEVSVAANPGDEEYRYECSADRGGTWPEADSVTSASTTARIPDLVNGTEYVCRAFASNVIGVSAASPLSDVVRPCSGLLECSPLAGPVLAGIVGLLTLGIIIALIVFVRERTQGYVLAVLDVVYTANLGKGSRLGIELVRSPGSRQVTGIVANRGANADFQIRPLGKGRFRVRDKVRRQEVASGDSVVVVDSIGVRHQLVLRAFSTKAASAVATRR
jgi:Fibronectin type III domain/von Willebrand factor type A domain